jgi:hypothetical protein
VPGLQPGPGDPVRTRRRSPLLPGLLLYPGGPQVEVVLQQLLIGYLPLPLIALPRRETTSHRLPTRPTAGDGCQGPWRAVR